MTVCDAKFYDGAMTSGDSPSMLALDESPWLEMYDEAVSWIGLGEPVVDLGCGTGRFAHALYKPCRERYGPYLGLDFAVQVLDEAKRYIGPTFCEEHEIVFSYQDLTTWKPEGAIDGNTVFTCLEVLEHLEGDLDLIQRIPPGLRLIFSVPNYPSAAHVRDFRLLREIWERYEPLVVFNRWSKIELGTRNAIHLIDSTRRVESW